MPLSEFYFYAWIISVFQKRSEGKFEYFIFKWFVNRKWHN